jgi:hypothetical protein
MTMTALSITETLGMLPRLALIAVLLAGSALAVGKVNASTGNVVSDVMLVGGELTKPSGVGFVLAVGLQRMR